MFKCLELPASEGGKHKWIFRPEEIFQVYKEANSKEIEVEFMDGSSFTFSFETPEIADEAFKEIQKALVDYSNTQKCEQGRV